MNRSIQITLALSLAVSLMAFPMADAATQAQTSDQAAEKAAPGEQLGAALGVQQAELDAEIQDRAFGLEIAQANTSDEAAAVVAERLAEIEPRIDELEDQSTDVEQTDSDNSSNAAEAATLAAEAASLERQAQTAGAVADQLPEDVLADNGINVTAIEELATNAGDLSSEEVVALAQSIAGESVGTPLADDWEPGVPEDVEIPDNAADRSETAGNESAGNAP